MTQPKEIYFSCNADKFFDEKTDVSIVKFSKHKLRLNDIKYISEEHFNSTIEKWKEEEKIWIKQLEEKDKELEKALKHIRLLLATMDGELEANREEYGESYAEHLTSINAKEYLDNYKTR